MDSFDKNEEITLPKATIDKIIQESCSGRSLTKEGKILITSCAIEFIHMITTEANELCEKELKKTINHDHIYQALTNHGYESFISECNEAHEEHLKLCSMKPSKTNKLKISSMSMEELYNYQMSLFENAKKEQLQQDNKTESVSEEDKKEEEADKSKNKPEE